MGLPYYAIKKIIVVPGRGYAGWGADERLAPHNPQRGGEARKDDGEPKA